MRPGKSTSFTSVPWAALDRFYLLLIGDHSSEEILPLMKEMFEFIRVLPRLVPAPSAKYVGTHLDINLGTANYLAKRLFGSGPSDYPGSSRLSGISDSP